MIGKGIDAIYYAPKVEGWEEIKDKEVIHVPMGFLTIQLSDTTFYKLNTDYQSWCGGIFGIQIERIQAKEFFENKYVQDENNLNVNKNWQAIAGQRIRNIKWYWKTDSNEVLDGTVLNDEDALEFLFEDLFLPESIVFTFENNKKVYFSAFAPDSDYKLITGAEEIMIFFDEAKLLQWGIASKGFEIEQKSKTPHNKVQP